MLLRTKTQMTLDSLPPALRSSEGALNLIKLHQIVKAGAVVVCDGAALTHWERILGEYFSAANVSPSLQ